ncbi:MAG: signal peptidase I [Candidatus Paceibacterota bacterium]
MLFRIIQYIFVTGVVVIALLLLSTLVPIPGNVEVKIVQSGSMEPAIKTGSIVVIRPSDVLKIGDVVTFGEDTKTQVPTTHRIVETQIRSGVQYYTTKGDANDTIDPYQVPQSEVIGKVLFDIPFLGYLLDTARKPLGFFIFIILPASIVVIDEIVKIYREIKRIRKEKNKKEEEGEEPINDEQKNEETS